MITIEVKNQVNILVDGYVQINDFIYTTKNGTITTEISEGRYHARAFVQGYRGITEEIDIKNGDTITLWVTRG